MNSPIALRQGTYVRSDSGATDHTTWVEFFLDTIPDEIASQREGRPIYRDEERVRLYFPGNQQTRPVYRVTQEYIDKYPKEYAAFKSGTEISPDGTPIEMWPVLRKSQILELKALGFKTVEQIAAMNDMVIQKVGMGARQMKGLAESFLDDQAASAHNARLSAENEKMTTRTAELEKKLAEQGALLNEVHNQLMAMRNLPPAVATNIPGMNDPIEQARQAQAAASPPQGGQSSFADLPAPRPRGRPPKNRDPESPEAT